MSKHMLIRRKHRAAAQRSLKDAYVENTILTHAFPTPRSIRDEKGFGFGNIISTAHRETWNVVLV